MMQLNCFFDLDGVLVDACDWHYASLNTALQKIAGFKISLEDHYKTYNGLPTKIKLQMLNVDKKLHQSIADLKAIELNEIIEQECSVDEDKIKLFEFLKNSNVKIACVTNSIRETAFKILKKKGIMDYFNLILGNEDVERNKPYPDPYNYAVSFLNVDPTKTVIVEDSEKGFMAATQSCVSLLWKVPNAKYVTYENFIEVFGS